MFWLRHNYRCIINAIALHIVNNKVAIYLCVSMISTYVETLLGDFY